MKRTVGVAISLLLMANALFAQAKSLDKNNAYYVYLKGTNTKITDEEYLNYAKVVEKDTYDKYIDSLKTDGYTLGEDGLWTKDNHTITVIRSADNSSLNITLKENTTDNSI